MRQTSREECRERLAAMLEEIRDDLRAVDPLEDEIDRRNADYSRSSIEIIKAYIEPDSTIAGKLGILVKALFGGNDELRERIAHKIYRISFLSPSSLLFPRRRDEGDFTVPVSKADMDALAKTEADFFQRMQRRLSLKRINAWLDEQGGRDKVLLPLELIQDEDSFIRFVYALLYGDSRKSFDYAVEEGDDNEAPPVAAAGYVVPDIHLRKKHGATHEPGT
jgi:hypothetical protein